MTQQQNVSEELLYLRKRARRRLVGAIALVIFALTVLWTVLDGGPPDNMTRNHPVEIISSAPSLASKVADVPQPAPVEASVASAVVLQPTPGPVVASVPDGLRGNLVNIQQPQNKPAIVPAPTSVPVAHPVASKPVIAKPVVKPASKPAVKVDNKPASKPSAASSKPTRDPQRILDGLDEDQLQPATPAKTGKYYVQIAALADVERASQIAAKLRSAGLPVISEKVKTDKGELTRIRVGPTSDESKAKEWQKKAQAAGVTGQVVGSK